MVGYCNMSVDVVYQGLTIARGAGTKISGAELFIESEAPMPVATQVTVSAGAHVLHGRVSRVVEGVGAGMAVVAASGEALPGWLLHMKPQQRETVVMEAESEYDERPVAKAPVAQAAPAQVQPAPVAQAAPVVHAPPPVAPPEPEPEVREMIAEPPPSTATPEPAAEAKAPVSYESTVELAIPRDDAEGEDAAAAEKKGRGNKKKAGSRRR